MQSGAYLEGLGPSGMSLSTTKAEEFTSVIEGRWKISVLRLSFTVYSGTSPVIDTTCNSFFKIIFLHSIL
jgi:hypothetical protein